MIKHNEKAIPMIEIKKLNYLYNSSKNSLLANLFAAVVIYIYFFNKSDFFALSLWLFFLAIIIATRLYSIVLYRKNSNKYKTYLRFFYYLMFTTAITWSVTPFLIFTSSIEYDFIILIVILGLAIGAISSLSSNLFFLISFQSALIIPVIIRMLLYRTSFYNSLSLLFLAFFFLIITISRQIHKMIYSNLVFEEEHKKSVEKLTLSENKFRSIFDHAPVGIFYYNPDYIIYDCNEEFSKILETDKQDLVNYKLTNITDKRILDALTSVFNSDNGFYEGEYITTFSKSKIWITLICSPLYDKNKEIMGAVGIVQDRTEMQLIEEKIRHLAYHDSLTGLPNRLLLKDRLTQSITQASRHNYFGAILFLDLDNFKNVNDTLGHQVGDLLLKDISNRIKNILRNEDTVSRIGGDEFVILLPKLNNNEDLSIISVNKVAQKIHKKLQEPFIYLDHKLFTSTSIGITLFCNKDENIDDLLKNADTAMYEAKNDGRGTTHFYRHEMNSIISNRLKIEYYLRTAIETGELETYLQPIYNGETKVLEGAETLLRWKHPELGFISPGEFIPIAEDTNLIIPIGEWVIDNICRNIKKWFSMFNNPFKYISINISINQLRQDNFVETLLKYTHQYNIEPQYLLLEITENILIGNFESIINKISILRSKGFKFALDDFGTGYSSLTYLKKLEIDIIKIDREFIIDINNDSNDTILVEAILSIASNFKMKVVAEGVEDIEQVNKLVKMGCHYFQGFYFSKPMDISQFEKLLAFKNLPS